MHPTDATSKRTVAIKKSRQTLNDVADHIKRVDKCEPLTVDVVKRQELASGCGRQEERTDDGADALRPRVHGNTLRPISSSCCSSSGTAMRCEAANEPAKRAPQAKKNRSVPCCSVPFQVILVRFRQLIYQE